MTSLVRPRGVTVVDAYVGVLGGAVGDDLEVGEVADPAGQLDRAGLVGGDDQGAAGDDLADEGLEGVVDLVHRGVVRVVVQLDVEDDRDLGVVLLEAAVALVRLRDEDVPFAVRGVGARALQVAADGVRGGQAQRGEGDGQHGGGGGLAVGAGHRDGPQAVHQGGQGVRAVDDRDGQLVRPEQLRVVGADGAGDDHAGRVLGQMRGRVPDVHGRPQRPQRLRGGGLLGVAARHLRPALGEDLRDARHSGAADADEVRSFHGGGNAGCHLYSCGRGSGSE
ncbi:hypothetical protein GA0115255_123106 [Streptomyces sp. Ncost-T6T-2b]|nr:hypothetical protein GA0115255_123106 [Streptomyces sp. Ncost-T6T-2b]